MKADDAAADALLGKKERDYLKDSNVVEACRKDRGNLAGGIAYACIGLFTQSHQRP